MKIELNTFPINFNPETMKWVYSWKGSYRFCEQNDGILYFKDEKRYRILRTKLKKFGVNDDGLNMILFLLEFTRLDILINEEYKKGLIDSGIINKHISSYNHAIDILKHFENGYGLSEITLKLFKEIDKSPSLKTFCLNGNMLINDIKGLLENLLGHKIGIENLQKDLEHYKKMRKQIILKSDQVKRDITIRLYSSIFKSLPITTDSHRFIIVGYLLYFNDFISFNEIKREVGMTDKDLREQVFAFDDDIDNQVSNKPKLYDYEQHFRNNIKKQITSAKKEIQ